MSISNILNFNLKIKSRTTTRKEKLTIVILHFRWT